MSVLNLMMRDGMPRRVLVFGGIDIEASTNNMMTRGLRVLDPAVRWREMFGD